MKNSFYYVLAIVVIAFEVIIKSFICVRFEIGGLWVNFLFYGLVAVTWNLIVPSKKTSPSE